MCVRVRASDFMHKFHQHQNHQYSWFYWIVDLLLVHTTHTQHSYVRRYTYVSHAREHTARQFRRRAESIHVGRLRTSNKLMKQSLSCLIVYLTGKFGEWMNLCIRISAGPHIFEMFDTLFEPEYIEIHSCSIILLSHNTIHEAAKCYTNSSKIIRSGAYD